MGWVTGRQPEPIEEISPVQAKSSTPVRKVSRPPEVLPKAVALDKAMRLVSEESDHLLVSCRVGSGLRNVAPIMVQHAWIQDGWFYKFPFRAKGSQTIREKDPADPNAFSFDISWDVEPGVKQSTCEVHPRRVRAKATFEVRNESGEFVDFQARGCGGYGTLEDGVTLTVWSQEEPCKFVVEPTGPYERVELPIESIQPGAHLHLEVVVPAEKVISPEDALRAQEDKLVEVEDSIVRQKPGDIVFDIRRLNDAIERLAPDADPELEEVMRALLEASRFERENQESHEAWKKREGEKALEELEALEDGIEEE